jgi:hypothetical protein
MIWLKEADACTRFFHLKANSRNRRKFIPCLKNSTGDYVWAHEDKEKVMNIFMAYWDRLSSDFLH